MLIFKKLRRRNEKENNNNVSYNYWNFREDSANIKWINNITVIINGHKLNILHDNYDCRRVKSFK